MIRLTARDGHELDAYLARPAGDIRGGLVVGQEMYGVNDYIRGVCDRYASEGYLSIAPALYDRLEPGLAHTVEREAFAAATATLVERVAATVAALLDEAGVRRERVDTVYFTGGGSAVPQLRARLAAELPAAKAVEGDLHGSIGTGLAIEAGRRYG